MSRLWLQGAAIAAAACIAITSAAAQAAPRGTLQAFAGEQEISDLFRRWAEERKRRESEERAPRNEAPPAAPAAGALLAQQSAGTAKAVEAAADSITSVQHAGVDEGGIVKRHGDHLVILRRGRLFTVKVGENELTPVSTVDAFGAGIDPRGAWYDELLVSGNTIAVIGYSYARGGTEIGLHEISRAGRLAHKATYHLRSNDYYSSRNYASRLLGTRLVFYTPLKLDPWGGDPWSSFPAMRRWRPGASASDFRPIAPATRIYRTDEPLDPWQGVALHTVTVCDLEKAEMDCESTAVMGPPGRVFYVSSGAVYVWTTAWSRRHAPAAPASALFRIPLDGSAPTALKVAGSPIDQFSFLEGDDGHLNVLVRARGRGEAMWGAERNAGAYALLRIALDAFSDGRGAAPEAAYKALPRPAGHAIHNRYVGAYLLYGAGAGWRGARRTLHAPVYAVRYAGDAPAQEIALAHGVDRIEALGADAVVIGSDGRDLHFTSLRLADAASAQDRYTRKDAAQGETRSHGFYYKTESDGAGTVGLPIIAGDRAASQQLRRESAAVLFLRNRSLRLSELGALESHPDAGANDGCRASCVDWYGNSRPLFIGNRVFALMGYEIVEGEITRNRVSETRRVNFAPVTVGLAR
ncbi:MAG: beta-propeller domain-containing protein [Burkholderiales bacterium]|nr:beta-propeller domain-containing protein [Burkholderiales bacterium]